MNELDEEIKAAEEKAKKEEEFRAAKTDEICKALTKMLPRKKLEEILKNEEPA